MNWKKVAGKWGKWAFGTAAAGIAAAASQGADVTDPQVAAQVALTALVAGFLGAGQNAWKHRAASASD
jgi:hypothetical protein